MLVIAVEYYEGSVAEHEVIIIKYTEIKTCVQRTFVIFKI